MKPWLLIICGFGLDWNIWNYSLYVCGFEPVFQTTADGWRYACGLSVNIRNVLAAMMLFTLFSGRSAWRWLLGWFKLSARPSGNVIVKIQFSRDAGTPLSTAGFLVLSAICTQIGTLTQSFQSNQSHSLDWYEYFVKSQQNIMVTSTKAYHWFFSIACVRFYSIFFLSWKIFQQKKNNLLEQSTSTFILFTNLVLR